MFDIDPVLDLVLGRKPISLPAGMNRLTMHASKTNPHPSWQRVAAYDWNSEFEQLTQWATHLLETDPPKKPVTGFYFGLFNPVERRRPTAELYLAGFSGEGDEWWFGERSWWPKGRYSGSKALRAMYAEAYRTPAGLENDLEYPVALTFALLSARALASTTAPTLWLGRQPACRIAAGFDSGDIFEVGRITGKGFRRAPTCPAPLRLLRIQNPAGSLGARL